jgi:hypothetical protein
MGGIGKTSLATRLAHDVASSFERVYWRSLRDVPPISNWLAPSASHPTSNSCHRPASRNGS